MYSVCTSAHNLTMPWSLEALERSVLLQVGHDIHAFQSHLPGPPLKRRVTLGVYVPQGPPQRLDTLRFPPVGCINFVTGGRVAVHRIRERSRQCE